MLRAERLDLCLCDLGSLSEVCLLLGELLDELLTPHLGLPHGQDVRVQLRLQLPSLVRRPLSEGVHLLAMVVLESSPLEDPVLLLVGEVLLGVREARCGRRSSGLRSLKGSLALRYGLRRGVQAVLEFSSSALFASSSAFAPSSAAFASSSSFVSPSSSAVFASSPVRATSSSLAASPSFALASNSALTDSSS